MLEDPTHKLSERERVNLMDILGTYRRTKELTKKQDQYAEDFCLSLMQEFFANYDKIRDPDYKVRETNAYARTTQLNDDFHDLHNKLDAIETHLWQFYFFFFGITTTLLRRSKVTPFYFLYSFALTLSTLPSITTEFPSRIATRPRPSQKPNGSATKG